MSQPSTMEKKIEARLLMTSEQLSELKLSTLNRICEGEGAVELPVSAENPTQPPATKGNMCGKSALS
jgi:hypothetical protein